MLKVDKTYDGERGDDFAWRLRVGADDLRDKVRGDADNADHCDQGNEPDDEEELGQRSRAIVWDTHVVRAEREFEVWKVFGPDSSVVNRFCRGSDAMPASGRSVLGGEEC